MVHKEYTNAYPTTFVITKSAVIAENANVPNGEGPINMNNFKPFPKNPVIAKFFMQLGRFDELGSGVLNINKFCKAYSGHDHPEFIEGAIFRTIIPLDEDLVDAVNDTLTFIDRINDTLNANDRKNDAANDTLNGVDSIDDRINDTLNANDRKNDAANDTLNGVDSIDDRINDTLNANDRKNDAANDTLNGVDSIDDRINKTIRTIIEQWSLNMYKKPVREKLIKMTVLLFQREGLKAEDLAMILQLKLQAIKRYLKILKEKNLIERPYAKKEGGYYLTQSFKTEIEKKQL